MANPRLVILSAPRAGSAFELKGVHYRVGRSRNMDIVIDDDTVSSFHCEIVRQDDGSYRIIDEGQSTNGTRIGGRLITDHVLEDGDIIQVGQIELLFDARQGLSTTSSKYTGVSTGISFSSQPITPNTEVVLTPSLVTSNDDQAIRHMRTLLLILGAICTILLLLMISLLLRS